MTTANEITKFETSNVYRMGFIGDSDLRPEYICVKVTDKTATFQKFQGTETFTKKIKVFNGSEYISYASYSMAPTIYAKNQTR